MTVHQLMHECHDCGLFQHMAPLRPGQVAECARCGAVLRRRRRDSLSATLSLSLTGLLLMAIVLMEPLITIRITGQERTTGLATLPLGFEEQNMPLLVIATVATTLVAPILRLAMTALVLLGLRLGWERPRLVTMFRVRAMAGPWAMIEVFLLGFFVAYSRLGAIATLQIGAGFYAVAALMLIMAWADTWIDEEATWDAIGRAPGPPIPARRGTRLLGCDACGLASHGDENEPCPRCATPLRHRKPDPVNRTWALLFTAALLYIPANIYPVLTVIRLGQGQPSTIIHGVVELIEYNMAPLALLVFVASILVPSLKLLGLAWLLIMQQRRSATALVGRTKLYRVIDAVGRWSMIDVFMVGVLVALVRVGSLASVFPGYGAVAFCGVVILTMLAALTFEPRLAWDRAVAAPAPDAKPGTVQA